VSQAMFDEIHNVIVSAICEDVQMVKDFDDHDPLGLAFYVHSLLRTGYTHLLLDSLPDAARFWVEEKVIDGIVSPYLDRDLAAIGLITFSLCRYRTCPDIDDERLTSLTEPHFRDNKGLFGSFFSTVLVGLGLQARVPQSHLCERFSTYIDAQLRDHAHTIFNDPKNLFAAHLWAVETGATSILETLRHECAMWALSRDCLPREQVYLSYILLEEAGQMPRSKRPRIKQCVEDSLKFVHTQSVESVFAPDIVEQYSYDVASRPEMLEQYGHPARPRLSRIMLSIGLVLERHYSLSGRLLFSRQTWLESTLRGIAYGALLLAMASLVYWLSGLAGIPFSLRTALVSKDLLAILGVFFVKLPVNLAWISVLVLLIISAFMFLHQLSLTGRRSSELEVIADIREFVRANWPVEVVLAIILLVLSEFVL